MARTLSGPSAGRPSCVEDEAGLRLAAGQADQVRQGTSASASRARAGGHGFPRSARGWPLAREISRANDSRFKKQSSSIRPMRWRSNGSPCSSTRPADRMRQLDFVRQIRAIDRDRKEYIRLLASESPEVHGAELAQLAERLGRRFDAGRWAVLARREQV